MDAWGVKNQEARYQVTAMDGVKNPGEKYAALSDDISVTEITSIMDFKSEPRQRRYHCYSRWSSGGGLSYENSGDDALNQARRTICILKTKIYQVKSASRPRAGHRKDHI